MVKEFIVEDFEDLQGLSEDKLKKLLHKATDYKKECEQSVVDADARIELILGFLGEIAESVLTSITD